MHERDAFVVEQPLGLMQMRKKYSALIDINQNKTQTQQWPA
jgi:hypothetical protein